MKYEHIKPYIQLENDNEYILELWNRNIISFNPIIEDGKAIYNNFEQFLSKMLEIERTFIEKVDQRPEIALKKDFKECLVKIKKQNGDLVLLTLYPYGYWGSWEIFKVDKSND